MVLVVHSAERGGHQLLCGKRWGRLKYQYKRQGKHLCGLVSPSLEELLSQGLSRGLPVGGKGLSSWVEDHDGAPTLELPTYILIPRPKAVQRV